jgi:two-component system, OmpR family, sensor histidine kinase KdpD
VSADHVAIALPADPEVAQTVLHRGRRLARYLGIDWVAILIQPPSQAEQETARRMRDLVAAAGGRMLCRQSRDVARALVEVSRAERARLLVIGASRRPRFLRRLIRGTTERLIEARRPFDVVVAHPGADV